MKLQTIATIVTFDAAGLPIVRNYKDDLYNYEAT